MIYSLRSECRSDFEAFMLVAPVKIVRERHLLTASGRTAFVDVPIIDTDMLQGDPFPDAAFEFDSPACALEENSLERNWDS